MHQRHVESAHAILQTDPAGALRLAIDTIRWSVDWTVRETCFISPNWVPRAEDVAPVIELAAAVREALDRVVAEPGPAMDNDDGVDEDAKLQALVLARAFTTSGELIDLEEVAAELGIDLSDDPQDTV